MKRKILDELNRWKGSKSKKCLILQGARQVGKTYIVREFANQNYKANRYIEINFEKFDEASGFFEGDLTPETILRKIQNHIRFKDVNFRVDSNEPLFLFFDEIQKCPRALTSLKFFSEAHDKYHVIASGSLLGVALRKKDVSYPVGAVEHLTLYPFDFEEFLWAFGFNQKFVDNIKKTFFDTSLLTSGTHDELLDLFRKFIVIGGLPGPINAFLETKDYQAAYIEQTNLFKGYLADIERYADSNSLKIKIEKCFLSIPTHLKEQNKKFKYRLVDKNGRARLFEGALDWLDKAGLVVFCHNLKTIKEPIESYQDDDNFKLYMFDTGILLSMFSQDKRYKVLSGSEDIDIGGIYENAIANVLMKYHLSNKIFHYSESNQLEIDFITQKNSSILAVEVKSGQDIHSASLKNLSQRSFDFPINFIKTSGKLVKEDPNNIKNIPLYSFALIGTTNPK